MAQRFTVPGRPVGFKRPEQGKHGNRYSNRKYEEYKERIMWLAKAAGIKMVPKTSSYHQDVDNVTKAVMDALHDIAYEDDDQVGQVLMRRVDENGRQVGNVTLMIQWEMAKKPQDHKLHVEIINAKNESV